MRSPHLAAEVKLLPTSEGGRRSPVYSGYRGQFHLHGRLDDIADVEWYFSDSDGLAPGEMARCEISFESPEQHLPRIRLEIRLGYARASA